MRQQAGLIGKPMTDRRAETVGRGVIAAVVALVAAAAAGQVPVFTEDFAGAVVGQPPRSPHLTVQGAGVVEVGPAGGEWRCFASDPAGGPTGLSIPNCPPGGDFDLQYAFQAGGDAGSSHLYLAGAFGGGESLQIGLRRDGQATRLVVGHAGGTRGTEAVIPGLADEGPWVTIRAVRVGRSIRVNAWPYGQPEPAGWMVDARIGAHVAGGGGVQWRFRQFRVAEIRSRPIDPAERARQAALEQAIEEGVLAEADAAIERHRKGDALVRFLGPDGRPLAGAAVTVELARHEFLFGCNVMNYVEGLHTDAQREAYQRRFAELFNYGTVGFYWHWFEKEPGRPDFPLNDRIIAWCRSRGIRVKGHPLLWDSWMGVPMWMGEGAAQPPPEAQRRHVEAVMRHYAGQVESWEVVNEPANLRGIRIDEPYRWARAADPSARLIVNDYRVLDTGFPAFHELLAKAIADGVPFDGIGIQAHVPEDKRFPLDGVRETLDRYAALGKDLHITEFTPASSGKPIAGSHVAGTWDPAAQADYAVRFYRVCFAHPAVVAITWWGLLDSEWPQNGGLLTADLQPKPAYEALRGLIHGTWHTRVDGRTDDEGRLRFRGFFGDYRVAVDGRALEGTFRLPRPADAAADSTDPRTIVLQVMDEGHLRVVTPGGRSAG